MGAARMVLIMEYVGTRYCGFQWQDNVPTIQGETERALHQLTGEQLRVMAASRTDSGVHARGQVVGFRTGSPLPPQTFVSGLNHYLPPDIAVKAAHRVPDSFQVRRDALSREYSYYILNSLSRSPLKQDRAYRVAGKLDTEAINRACQALVGQHDFASFVTGITTGIKSTVRNILRAEIKPAGELVIFHIVADSFLPHQVRNTIGALIRVGLGRMSVSQFCDIIRAKKPGLAQSTAPAGGLCLMRINYPKPFGEGI